MTQSFEAIRQQLQNALRRALTREARHLKQEPLPQLIERTLHDPLATDPELHSIFAQPPLALLDFDTPGIQRYVFEGQRPLDIQGGSQQIADFTEADPKKFTRVSFYQHLRNGAEAVPPETVIYAGGGGGLMILAASEAENVAKAIAAILDEETKQSLHTVTAILPLWPLDLSSKPVAPPQGLEKVLGPLRAASRYTASLSTLEARLGAARSATLRLAPSVSADLDRDRCHTCHARPYSVSEPRDNRPELLCASCNARRQYGRQSKHQERQPQSFEEMLEGLPSRDLAVIYADGANVGQAFQEIDTPERHRALSLAVDQAMTHALSTVVARNPLLTEGDKIRVLTPICGGDDLVLVMPGIAAPKAVETLVEVFEKSFDLEHNTLLRDAFADAPESLRQRLGGFGLGVGLAVADVHFPVQFLLRYARRLLTSAKREIRRGERSAVDFMVLTSGTPLSERIEKLREKHSERKPKGERPGLLFTRRPYGGTAFSKLVHRTELLAHWVNPTQIHMVRQEIRRGLALSRSLWRYQHARAPEDESWAAYRKALRCPLREVDELLWQPTPHPEAAQDDSWHSTDFLDATELLGLLVAETTHQEESA